MKPDIRAETIGDAAAFISTSIKKDDGTIIGNAGLTKREWMAAMAMQGLMANPNELPVHIGEDTPIETRCARVSVILADALIEALNTPAPKEKR